jgi:hypothetical protein
MVQVFEKYDLYALGRMQYCLLLGPTGSTFPDYTTPDDTRVGWRGGVWGGVLLPSHYRCCWL